MQHEVMYLQRTKTFLNTNSETTVTFVNRDGKPGNYVNTVTPVPEAIADAPLCNCLTIILRQDYMMVALHTLPILILIIVHQLPNPFKKYIRHRLQKKDPSAAKVKQ
jgi:hypothetical protein